MNWRDRFRAPAVIDASVSKSEPTRGVVISDRDGKFQAYSWNRSDGQLIQITDSQTAVLFAAISHDGDWIFVHVESDPGTEIGHIHKFPFHGGESVDITPDLDPYPIFGLKATSRGVIGFGAARGSPALIVVDETSRALSLESIAVGLSIADDGLTAAVTLTTPGEGLTPRTQWIDLESGEVLDERQRMRVGDQHEDRAAVTFLDGDWMRPAMLKGGELIPIDFEEPGDVTPVGWSDDGSRILLLVSHRSRNSLYMYDVDTGSYAELVIPEGAIHPPDPILIDSDTALAIWSDARRPRRLIAATTEEWRPAVEVDDGEGFPGPKWEEFTYPSTEGSTIQGWLLRPDGEGPWPTVLYTHGGPTSVAQPSFNAICSAWFDAGFAVASINYRGSTTFGQSFRESLTGRIGGPDVDDVVSARNWLVSVGIADPDRIVKNGYSYGGYLTLQALGTHPDLWAVGIAGAPIADWTLGYDDMNDALKAYDMSLWGSKPEDRPEATAKASPRTYAANYRAPVLITQPEADTRTPIAPVARFVADLTAEGKKVELVLLQGGHAGAGQEHLIEMVEAWLGFALSELDMN